MRRWLALAGAVVLLAYCGWARESDARGLRRWRPMRCAPCPASCETVIWNQCSSCGVAAVPAISSSVPPPAAAPWNEAPAVEPAPAGGVNPPPIAEPPPTVLPNIELPKTEPPLPPVTPKSGAPKVEPLPMPPKVETPPVTPPVTRPPLPRPRPAVPPTTRAGKVHALLIAATEDKDAGATHGASAAVFANVLTAGLPKDRLTIEQISGKDVTLDNVRKKLNALPVTSSDTAVVAYFGPATYDETAKDFVLTFPTGEGSLPRGLIRATLLEKKPRLTVLFTDPAAERAIPDTTPKAPAPPEGVLALSDLFLGYRGVVDLQAAAVGETAFARGNTGGVFTLAFAQECGKLTDTGKSMTWAELFEATRVATDALYKDLRLAVLMSDNLPAALKKSYRDQTGQTPVALTPLSAVKPVAATPPSEEEAVRQLEGPVVEPNVATPVVPIERKAAGLIVTLPADARLFVDGQPTTQVAGVRWFETPELTVGKHYFYEVKVVAVRYARVLAETRRVKVVAGETTTVEFDEQSVVVNGVPVIEDGATAWK